MNSCKHRKLSRTKYSAEQVGVEGESETSEKKEDRFFLEPSGSSNLQKQNENCVLENCFVAVVLVSGTILFTCVFI